MRVGIDTSPLVQTRAGTARHVRGLLGELAGRPGLELVGLEAGGTGRLASVAGRALVPVPPRARLGGARRPPLHDIPGTRLAARAPRRDGPRPGGASPPGGVPALAPDNGRARAARRRARGGRGCRGVRLHARRARRAVGVPSTGFCPERRRPRLHAEACRRGRLRPRGGTLSPEATRRGGRGGPPAGVELRVAGAAGWGGVQAEAWVGEPTDEELAALMRGARCLVYPSLYEGFGSLSSRRWPARRRS